MTLREFAESLLAAATVEDKLRPPPAGLVHESVRKCRGTVPLCRPPGLEIHAGGRVRVPPADAWPDVAQRVRILHALANHELQAAERFVQKGFRSVSNLNGGIDGWSASVDPSVPRY